MEKKIQAIRGMHDLLPEDTYRWQIVEQCIRTVVSCFGYQEIRMPIVEYTDLFQRSIGEVTDIVEKEMYTFQDRNGDKLSLRPEGTASCVRAAIENGLLHNQTQRLWYQGPMFRHERPQKGRYRQFYQVGVEAYGMPGPDIDIELIQLTNDLWKKLEINELKLHLNTLGNLNERAKYKEELIKYLKKFKEKLDEDSIRRLDSNPLRILDSKNPETQNLIEDAPSMLSFLGKDSRAHFNFICNELESLNISYLVDTHLVRGLDYYSHTVFEWKTDLLGSQGTICAGGRYDGLVSQLGGQDVPAIGFALGMERLVSVIDKIGKRIENLKFDAYFILVGDEAKKRSFKISQELRDKVPGIRLITHCGDNSFKSQFKRADKSGAKLALIMGEDELKNGEISIKNLREEAEQISIKIENLVDFFIEYKKNKEGEESNEFVS